MIVLCNLFFFFFFLFLVALFVLPDERRVSMMSSMIIMQGGGKASSCSGTSPSPPFAFVARRAVCGVGGRERRATMQPAKKGVFVGWGGKDWGSQLRSTRTVGRRGQAGTQFTSTWSSFAILIL